MQVYGAMVGHVFSSKGLKPDLEKIKAVLEIESPRNKNDLQTYVSRFLPNLSDVRKKKDLSSRTILNLFGTKVTKEILVF